MKKIIIDGKEVSVEAASDVSIVPGRIVFYAKELGYFEPEALKAAEDACDKDIDLLDIMIVSPVMMEYLLKVYLEHAKSDLALDSVAIDQEHDELREAKRADRKRAAEESAREAEALIDTLP